MLRHITVTPLAAESLGARSMCTLVESSDVKILLDGGVSLGPYRFGFPPHPREYQALGECRKRIVEAAEKADVVTISHYHFDHHTPSYTDWFLHWSSGEAARQIYEGKLVLAKSYRDKVNFSQRHRGWVFSNTGGKHAERFEFADNRLFDFGDTSIRFSEPVFHGEGESDLGWLVMATIEHENERVLFASDVQGPMYTPTVEIILKEKPDLLIIGGPPAYLSGLVESEHIQTGIRNLERLVQKVPSVILEHHLLRDENWRALSQTIFETAAKAGHEVLSAAEFLGVKNSLLESQRKILFETDPPGKEFEKWMRMSLAKRKLIKPPV